MEGGRKNKDPFFEWRRRRIVLYEFRNVVFHGNLRLPAERIGFRRIETRLHTVACPRWHHYHLGPEKLRDIEYCVSMFVAQTVFIAFTFFSNENKPLDYI